MKVKYSLLFVASLFLIIHFGCTPDESKVVDINIDQLTGTWRLIKTIEIGHEDSTGRRDSETRYYIKHVSETHFTWIEYDKENEQLLGAGGGTFSLNANTYTEDIKFYFPPGANELGQAIPFSAKINEDGTWRHTGYAKVFEFDPDTGDNVMIDSMIIDELWEKIDSPSATSQDLVGTWTLSSYHDASDSIQNDWPDFLGFFKIVTPTHFNWVQYNKSGDEMMALGGGTYLYDGDGTKYIENLVYRYPAEPDQSQNELAFDCRIEGNLWYHKGKVFKMSGNTIYGDSAVIDEIWKRVEITPTVEARASD